ncbi:MAG: PqqD family protein [Chloroflexi bacterium]|nr:PqqD family protein [Chloroflexota bacterium]
MATPTNGRQIQLRDDVIITSLDDREGIVLDVVGKSYYTINQTALFLLNLLQENDNHVDGSTLKKWLLEGYDVSEDEAERDLADFVKRLHDRGLVYFS